MQGCNMISIKEKISNNLKYPIYEPYNINQVIFFDIETTGLSPKSSNVYLIGLAYYEKNNWQLLQWLSKGPKTEVELLKLFAKKIQSYKRLIHFNGNSFDIGYLSSKYQKYKLDNPFINIDSFDLYLKVTPYRKVLPFPNLKLNTLENYLGYKREDKCSPNDLIQIYSQFVGRCQYENLIKTHSTSDYKANNDSSKVTSFDLANILLLHNKEDIVGLLEVSSILRITNLFYQGIIENDIIEIQTKIKDNALFVDFIMNYHFPIELSLPANLKKEEVNKTPNTYKSNHHNHEYYINICKNQINICLPIINGKLKYYYEDYENYYYLPKEDTAIHKSVAKYVDKEFRIKATPYNSYSYVGLEALLNSSKDLIKSLNSLIKLAIL